MKKSKFYEPLVQTVLKHNLLFLPLQAGTVLVLKEPDTVHKEAHPSPALPRSRAEPAAKKPRVPLKPSQEPEQIFPCKKCNRYDKSHHRDWR